MLCVPWEVPPTDIELFDEVRFEPESFNEWMDPDLEATKARVGVFKVRHGDATWKRNVARVDRRVNLPNVLPPSTVVSRAYYKLVEIVRTMAIGDGVTNSLHLCEAPGGFAQAAAAEFPKLRCATVTSRVGGDFPWFLPAVLHHEKIEVLRPCGGGDLTRRAVRDEIVAHVGARQAQLVTADGAIDNETRPELAEQTSAPLLLSEVETALRVQAPGGVFVFKVFSIMQPITRQVIAALSQCYRSVSILKPFTSRLVNDERYIVCQDFDPARAPALPPLPDYTPELGYMRHIGTYPEEWNTEVRAIVDAMTRNQKAAIEQAVTLKSTSEDETSRPSGPHRGRGGRSGQRERRGGPPYPPRGKGQGRPTNRTS